MKRPPERRLRAGLPAPHRCQTDLWGGRSGAVVCLPRAGFGVRFGLLHPLFDPPSSFDKRDLAKKLHALAAEGIWLGGSSWKYEGWLDQIYTRQRYTTRGRFSKKKFEAECLAEYAETFPIVCGDFSFYQFPTPQFWQKLFGSASPDLRFALKVPEEITGAKMASYLKRGSSARFVPRTTRALPAAHSRADLRIRGACREPARVCLRARPLPGSVAHDLPLRSGGAESRLSSAALLRLPARAWGRARPERVGSHASAF